MNTNAGVWIDHHKAVVVLVTDEGHNVQQILAEPDPSATSPGQARVKNSYTPNDFVAEDKRERKVMAQLKRFYDEVIAHIRHAQTILILGPGEAKGELRKRIASKKLRGQIAEIETADKLTDNQIAQHVRKYFRETLEETRPG
jgi:stalled ribosome rescue protein Dom34